jgi:nitroreductase
MVGYAKLNKKGEGLMDVYETIYERRTVHKFKPEKVPQDKLKKILEAGLQSSSAFNQQPWEFIVVTDQATVKKLAQYKYDHNMQGLLASKVPQEEAEKLAGIQRDGFHNSVPVAVIYNKDKTLPIQSCWNCITTIWLAACAESLGLSAAFFGLHAQGPIRELLGMPEDYEIAAILRIGIPEVIPDAQPKKSLEECLYYDHFSKGQMP